MGNVSVVANTVSITDKTATINTINDNTILAAPGAGLRIVVHELAFQQASATATTVVAKTGTTAWLTFIGMAQGDGYVFSPTPGKEKRCGANEALILNLSAGQNVTYTLRYSIESV